MQQRKLTLPIIRAALTFLADRSSAAGLSALIARVSVGKMRTAVLRAAFSSRSVWFVHFGSMGPWLTTVLYDPQLAHWGI